MTKGVVLAGGEGSRLNPCTTVVNKHLMPIYDEPMIYYPIRTLVQSGVDELLIVTGGKSPGEFLKLLKNGKEFGLKSILYAYQESSGGIAAALKLAQSFVGKEKFFLILGDNIIFDDLTGHFSQFLTEPFGSAKIFLKKIPNPVSFGVAEVENGKITNIVEKPKEPKTDLAVIGIYLYDSSVFDIIDSIQVSKRGELEITDVNHAYIQSQSLTYSMLDSEWLDTGTFESLHQANCLVAKMKLDNKSPQNKVNNQNNDK